MGTERVKYECPECGGKFRVPPKVARAPRCGRCQKNIGAATDGDGEEYQPYVSRLRKRKKRKKADSLVAEEPDDFTGFDKGYRNVALALSLALVAGLAPAVLKNGATATTISVTVAIVFLVFGLFYWQSRCRQCKRIWAYKPTGNREEGGWLSSEQAEFQCRFCGHTKWVKLGHGGG